MSDVGGVAVVGSGSVDLTVFGELMLSRLTAEGIDTTQVRIGPRETGVADIPVYAATGQNDIAILPNAAAVDALLAPQGADDPA